MANLKELKVRIGSVKSTQKITKAMKMVAAAKLRRSQEQAEAARPYAERMQRMLVGLAANLGHSGNAPELLAGTGREVTHLFVIITSHRGLCGGLNSSLVRAVRKQIALLQAQKKRVKLLCIGKKGFEQLRPYYRDLMVPVPVEMKEISKGKQPRFADAQQIAQQTKELFEQEEFDVCTVVYNRFLSVMSQQVTFQRLIPLDIDTTEEAPAGNHDEAAAIPYDYEPDEAAVLSDLLPRNLSVQYYRALLESIASEHGARMTAMDNATRNAGEMIKRLTLEYNRRRQAAITTELIEIISGAEAV